MAEKITLAVLGGSSVATPQLIYELCQRTDRPPIEVKLIGRTRSKLDLVERICQRLAKNAFVPVDVGTTTDILKGLEGADYILNQIRVGGYQARAYDEKFPQNFGIPGEETFGPGGMNLALRTIPVVLESCQAIEKAAPQALLINLTNPSSYIQFAVSTYSRVNVVGVCDSPIWIAEGIAALMGVQRDDLWVGYCGMHHFGWITSVVWKGKDVLAEVLQKIEKIPDLPVDADMIRAMRAIPTSYFKYYYHPNQILEKQKGQPARAEQLQKLESQILSDFEGEGDGIPPSLKSRKANWYAGIVVPLLLAHWNDARCVYTLNLTNGTTYSWMPAEAIIETPALVTRQGFYALVTPSLPGDMQAMLRTNAAFEMLWVEAVVEKDYSKALRAMMLNHEVHNLDQAKAILKEIWK